MVLLVVFKIVEKKMLSPSSEPSSPGKSNSAQQRAQLPSLSSSAGTSHDTSGLVPPTPGGDAIGISPQIAPDIVTLPTVLITYKHPVSAQPRSVKARIDRNVPLDEVIRQLCTSAQLAINEPAENFALRDASNNDLITNENVNRSLSEIFEIGRKPSSS